MRLFLRWVFGHFELKTLKHRLNNDRNASIKWKNNCAIDALSHSASIIGVNWHVQLSVCHMIIQVKAVFLSIANFWPENQLLQREQQSGSETYSRSATVRTLHGHSVFDSIENRQCWAALFNFFLLISLKVWVQFWNNLHFCYGFVFIIFILMIQLMCISTCPDSGLCELQSPFNTVRHNLFKFRFIFRIIFSNAKSKPLSLWLHPSLPFRTMLLASNISIIDFFLSFAANSSVPDTWGTKEIFHFYAID